MAEVELEDTLLRRRQTSVVSAVPNPFANPAPWTVYEVIKAFYVTFILLPWRIYWAVVLSVGMVIVARIAVFGAEELAEDRGCWRHMAAFPFWRRWLMAPLAPMNRLALACLGYWPGCITVNDYRKDKSSSANILVVAPHMTFLDSLIIAVAFPPVPSGVGYTGLLGFPVMRSLSIAGQAILVDRTNSDSRQSCKQAIQDRADEKWTGPPVMIFPEGVITNGSALIQFKLGAFSAGQPVTPVCLRYTWEHYNPAGCGRNYNMPLAFLRTALQIANFCEVDVLDTYVPSSEEAADPKLFANNVREIMAAHLEVPTTEHSYEDAFLAYESKAHVGADFVVSELQKVYGCSYDNLKAALRAFEKCDATHCGVVDFDEFQAVAKSGGLGARGRRAGRAWQRLFAFFDQDNSGGIEFREFLQVVALLSGKGSPESRAKLAFLVYDVYGNGSVPEALLDTAVDDWAEGCAESSSSLGSASGGIRQPPPSMLLPGLAPDGTSPTARRTWLDGAAEAEGQELDFARFNEFIAERPGVVNAALGLVSACFGTPEFAG